MVANHEVRDLFSSVNTRPHPGSPTHASKDKLAASKAREREIKEAVKEKKLLEKNAKEAAKAQDHALIKEERLEHDTKRAAKDKREAARKEQHAETGQMCEHGVWRCKICFPHKSQK